MFTPQEHGLTVLSEAVPEPFFSTYSRLCTFHPNTNYWGDAYSNILLAGIKCIKRDVVEQKLSKLNYFCNPITFNASIHFCLHLHISAT